jgi:GNAT superfamily N-acetyltransferase
MGKHKGSGGGTGSYKGFSEEEIAMLREVGAPPFERQELIDALGLPPMSPGVKDKVDVDFMTLNYKSTGELLVSVSFSPQSTNPVVSIERIYAFKKGATPRVEHSYFRVHSDYMGQGVAKKMLPKQVAFYRKMGIKRVDIDAVGTGGYAWAKYGFNADRQTREVFAATIRKMGATSIPKTPAHMAELASVKIPLKDFNQYGKSKLPEVSWQLGRVKSKVAVDGMKEFLDGKGNVLVGKMALMSNSWSGRMKLAKESQDMKIFRAYVGEK